MKMALLRMSITNCIIYVHISTYIMNRTCNNLLTPSLQVSHLYVSMMLKTKLMKDKMMDHCAVYKLSITMIHDTMIL